MATSANNFQDHDTTNYRDSIAATVRAQLSFVSSFNGWLDHRSKADGDHNVVVSMVKRRLESYKQWILEAENVSALSSDDVEPWTMKASMRPGSGDGLQIVVTGPGSDNTVEINTTDEEEAEYLMSDKYLGYMIKMCQTFSQMQGSILSLLKAAKELEQEEAQLSQPAETTVQTHIRRLKEYNDMKDIGQQLIGLIAENRAVPIRTLYDSGQYGVTAED
ncbi:hypothetical protein VTK56DRAFT_5463 [Thermocarpiscus australiensis]